MKEVSKSSPCPACGKPDWCARSDNGERLRCMRDGNAPEGMRLVSQDADGGSNFVVTTQPASSATPPTHKLQRFDAEAFHATATSAITSERIAQLASTFGTDTAIVERLSPGWATRTQLTQTKAGGAGWSTNYPDGAWTFAERDGQGKVVGVSLRASDGRKGAPKGSARGITIPTDLQDGDGPILVVEGASDVAAALALGFRTVGRPSNSAGADHLAVLLKGQDVVIVGENDERDGRWPGRDGALAIAAALARSWGVPVKWCLPPDGCKDMRHLLQLHGDAGAQVLDSHLQDSTECAHPPASPPTHCYTSFPIEAVPDPLRTCAATHAEAINVDPAGIITAMLAACASAVSSRFSVDLGRGFQPPIVLWGAVVGAPSDGKSPAIDVALAPVRTRRAAQAAEYADAVGAHRRSVEVHKTQVAEWRRGQADGTGTEYPSEPESPPRRQASCSDCTIQSLHELMADNDGAILLERDELNALLDGFGKYGGTRGGDEVAAFCQAWNGSHWDVSRLTRDARLVQRACLSLIGGITRGSLTEHFSRLNKTGFLARTLLAWPPMLDVRRWDDDRIAPMAADRYEQTWNALYELRRDNDHRSLTLLTLTQRACTVFADAQVRYKRAHAATADEALQAMLGKLDAQAARIAGVLHLVQQVNGTSTDISLSISADTMEAAVAMTDWYMSEALRVYALLTESAEARKQRKLAETIDRCGGEITPAELRRNSRAIGSAEDAKLALTDLANAGYGYITHPKPSERGGRPRDMVFRRFPSQANAS